MRQAIFIGGVSALLCAAIAFYSPNGASNSGSLHQAPPDMRWQLTRTADPETGKVPSGALMKAYHTLQQRGFFQSAGERGTETFSHWTAINDAFPTLSVTRITYDPNNTNTFYFCTGEGWYNFDAVKGNGVFKSDDGGDNWYHLTATDTSLFDYCQDMAVHPLTSDIYVATRTGGLQRSTDGGTTWQKVLGYGAGSGKNSVCDIEITSDGGVFASIGIFETDGIYYSPTGDYGTFVKQTTGLPTAGYFRIEMATAPSDPNVAYSIFCNSSDYKVKGVYKTTDRGANWFSINTPENNLEFAAKQAWYDLSLAVSPTNPDVVAMGGLNVWRTRDGGLSWERMSSGGLDSTLVRYMHVDQHEVYFHTDDEVYFGNDGGIWKTDNFTAEQPFIYDRNTGYNVTQFYAGAMQPVAGRFDVMGGTQDNGTPYITEQYDPTAKMVSGGDGAFVAYHPTDPDIFYTASQLRRMFRFDNGGMEIPDTITNPNLNDGNVLFINPFIMDASNPEVLYMCSNVGVWRFDNASTSDTSGWVKAATMSGVLSALATSADAPGVLFVGRNSGAGDIFRIDTAYTSTLVTTALNIDPLDSLPDAAFTGQIYCSSITADNNDADHVVVTYSNYNVKSIWETFNALDSTPIWRCIEGDLPDMPVYATAIHPERPDVIYVATELGVFYTNHTDGYNTQWIPSTAFPNVRTDMVKIKPNDGGYLIAATHGRGLWQGALNMGDGGISNDVAWLERGPGNVGGRTRTIMVDPNDPTGKTVWAGSVSGGLWKTTDIDAVGIKPQTAQLVWDIQVYPNPVQDVLHIGISGISDQVDNIRLLDMQGRVVATIAMQTAVSTLHWTVPAHLRAGQYLLVAEADEQRLVRKVVLL